MLKVLNITSDKNIGGAGKLILIFLKEFDREKFSVSVLMPRDSLLKNEVEKLGIGVIETDYIAESVVEHHVKLTGGEAPQRPVHKIAFDEVSNSLVGCFVLFDDVQFATSELNKNWTDNGEATNRTLIDEDGRIMVVRTNPTATFATKPLPSGSGSIGGVITVFNGVYQLMVADINDVNMYGQRF